MPNLEAHNITTLIVDDDLAMRVLMRESLEPLGYNILEAADGEQAIAAIKQTGADIVLMDVQMPVMDGFTTCRELRKLAGLETLPILIITGLDDANSIEEAYKAGATDFITKPIDWLILKNRVRYMLRASSVFEKLRKQEARLAEAQRIAKIGNWEIDIRNNRLEWSDETYCIFGRKKDDSTLTRESFLESVHPDDRSLVERTYLNAIRTRQPFRMSHRIQLPSGDMKYVEEQCKTVYDEQGEPLRAVGTVQDISDRMLAEKRIRTLSQAVEQSPVSVMITDTEARIEYVNRSYELTTGYPASEVVGEHTHFMYPDLSEVHHLRDLQAAMKSDRSWQGELQNRKKDGTLYWLRIHIAPVQDELGHTRNFLFIGEDITLQKEQEQQIIHQAHYDALTGLPNRFLVLDRLLQSIKEAHRYHKKVAILFLDLDDFKKVNDNLGHDVGDRLLVEAAERLSGAVREQDTVGRLGGDEFIIMLGDLESEQLAIPIAESILQMFRKVFRFDRREFVITASIGISVYPNDGKEPAELLRKADTAMYKSKEDGRNTLSFFTHGMNQGVARRLELEEQLHLALKGNEFTVHYQPLINSATQQVVGAEALLRWHNTALGNVSPDEFIPIAEQLGTIIPIGRYVIEQALHFTRTIRQQVDPGFTIAVNISPVQFRDTRLIHFIKKTLDKFELPGCALTLEITEGVVLSGHSYITDALISLHSIGIKIAMDDFGTGYSSFNYLRQFPFSTLKIDRSYILDISQSSSDHKLVSSIISMSHGLGLVVVAEGVETEEQLSYLKKQKCDFIQGYYYSKPLAVDAFMNFLLTWKL